MRRVRGVKGQFALFAATAVVLASPAVAQDYAFQGFAASDAMNQMHASMRDNMIVAPSQSRGERRRDTQGRDPGVAISTTYNRDPSVTRRVESRLVRAVSARDEESGRRLQAALSEHDFVRMFDQGMSRFGLRSGNAVDAMTAYWLAMWGAANNHQGQPSRGQVQAVKAQVQSGFDFSAAGLNSAAARQEFSETLIYQTLLLDTAIEDAQRRGATQDIQELGDEAQRQMRAAGMDLRDLRLTDEGLVPSA